MLFNWESHTAAADVSNLLPALHTLSSSGSTEILMNACLIIRRLCEHTSAGRRAILPHVADLFVKLSANRSEEHTSELQSLMRISYAVFCLKKKKRKYTK